VEKTDNSGSLGPESTGLTVRACDPGDVSPQPTDDAPTLRSEAYHITVDDGRDSFCALSIESPENDDAWLMSDTVYALNEMR